jgi:hypothetical protein
LKEEEKEDNNYKCVYIGLTSGGLILKVTRVDIQVTRVDIQVTRVDVH